MPLVGSALVTIGLDSSALMGGLSAATGALSRFGSGMGVAQGIGLAFAAVGVAAVGMGVQAVHAAADFQSGMTSLVTGAGEAEKNIGMVSSGILQMSTATGTSTDQLTAGMYMIESAGYHGAAGLAVLQASAEGAKVGNADLGVVANGVTTIMTDFASKNVTAAQATNELIATVASGKTHMSDLASSLAMILPTASSVKVGLNDVMGAMATMTGEGVPAADAATYLRQTLMTLASPAKAGATALKEIGLSAQQVSDEMKKSLPATLQLIMTHLKEKFPEGSVAFQNALKAIAGGSKQMQGVLDLTGSHMSSFESNVSGITSAVKQGGTGIAGWALVQQDFNFKMQQASAAVNAAFIAIGQQLLPVLAPLVTQAAAVIGQFTTWIQTSGILGVVIHGVVGAIQGFLGFLSNMIAIGSAVVGFFQQNQWAVGILMTAIGALGAVMALFAASAVANMILSLMEFGLSILTAVAESLTGATVMTTTFTTMGGMIVASMGTAAASIMAVAGPFLIAGAIIAAVVVGVIVVIKNWGTISAWLKAAWSGVVSFFQAAMQQISGAVSNVMNWFNQWKPLILTVGGIILTFLGPALIQAGVRAVVAGTQMAASFIANLVRSGVAAATSAAGGIAAFIAGIITTGTQAVIAGAKFVAGLIPAIISFGATAITTAATAIPAMIAGFISWAVAGWAAAAATIAATWPILLIIVGILALIAIIILLVTHWNQVVAFLTTVWNAIASFAKAVWGAIASFFVSLWNGIVAVFTAVWNVIKTVAFVIFAIIVAIILLPWIPLILFFRAHWTQIHALLVAAWNLIKTVATTVWNAIINFFTSIVKGWIIIFTAVWNFISPYLSAAWKMIQTVATTIWNAISSFFSTIWNAISSVATTVWGAITNFFQAEIRGWQIVITTVWNAISSFLSTIWHNISSTASSIWNNISSAIMNVVHTLQGKLSDAWNTVKSGFSNAFNALSGIAQGAWNGVKGAVRAGINAVIGLINNMINGVNNVTGVVGLPKIANIPYLAKGGMNLGGGLYVVGDAGPEILQLPGGSSVYPMTGKSPTTTPSSSGNSGGSGNTPVYLFFDGRMFATLLTDHLGNAMISDIRSIGHPVGGLG